MPTIHRRPVVTREGDRVTMFEIFFDLVFVFALTRVVSFMEASPGPNSAEEGLLLLVLLWWAWTAFNWLGNRVRLDSGYIRVGMLVAMTGLFVAGLTIPQAWTPSAGTVRPALVLALAFTVVRLSYISMFIAVSRDDRNLRKQLTLDVIPQSVSSTLLIVGACFGGNLQTILWACAFCIDFGGGRIIASKRRGWRLGSASHFVERHGLMLIIAIGETLVAAGTRTGYTAPVLGGALLGLTVGVCLWWLYFDDLADRAEQRLVGASADQQPTLARDGYTFGHFPLVAGVVYVALGVKLLLDDLSKSTSEPRLMTPVIALCGGVAVYFAGLELLRRTLTGRWRPIPAVAAIVLLAVPPVTRQTSSLVPLSLVVAILVCVTAVTGRDNARLQKHPTSAPDE